MTVDIDIICMQSGVKTVSCVFNMSHIHKIHIPRRNCLIIYEQKDNTISAEPQTTESNHLIWTA